MPLGEGRQGPLTATVFIWYPEFPKVGHCSMYIGNCDQSPIIFSHRNAVERNKFYHKEVKSWDYIWPIDPNYVSWWPGYSCGDRAMLKGKKGIGFHLGCLQLDVNAEGRQPDTVFDIGGLHPGRMLNAWMKFQQLPQRCGEGMSHYDIYKRNCAYAVWHMLLAGGILLISDCPYNMQRKITPKKVATYLTWLKNNGCTHNGWVKKFKSDTCPTKRQAFLASMLGLR